MRKPVLTIFYQFNPWHSTIGGIQTVIHSFIKYAPTDFNVRLVGTGVDPSTPLGKWHEAELDGRRLNFFPLLHLPNDNVRGLVPTTVKYTLALLKHRFSSDFMHFHRLEPALAALTWSSDKTLFIHNDIHKQVANAGDGKSILWQRFPQAYFLLERLLVGQFEQILSCNSKSVDFYRQRYPDVAQRVAYIQNTVDNDIFYPLPSEDRDYKRSLLAQQLGLAETTRFILFAGRLHPQKDPLLLVRSIAVLQEPDTHLLIAGDGELAGDVRSIIHQLQLTNRVTMLGPVKQAELADLHRLSSVFVLTSAYEGLPLVVLEALACGTPIVTTRCGETPNLLSPGSGVVCEASTPTAIAAALRQVLHHPQQYPSSACIQAAKPFDASSVVSSIYSNMLLRWKPKSPLAISPRSTGI